MSRFGDWASEIHQGKVRRNRQFFLALVAGAGLTAAEASRVRWTDVYIRTSGVRGFAHGVFVPVVEKWAGPLRGEFIDGSQEINYESEGFVLADKRTLRTNAGVRATHAVELSGALGPRSARLRATWIVSHLKQGVPSGVVAYFAGMKTVQRYEKYVTWTEEDCEEFVAKMVAGKPESGGLRLV